MIVKDGLELRAGLIYRLFNYLIEGLSGLAVISLFIGIWEIGAQYMGSFILPSPIVVLQRAYTLLSISNSDLIITLYRTAITTTLAFMVGSILGVICGSFKTLAKIFRPLMDIFLGIAPIVWIVLALFWFGIGDLSVMFSVFIAIFPLSFANAMLGVITLDKGLNEVCIAYRLNLYKRLKSYYMPHILPYLLNSLNIVVAMGIKIMIMAELLGAIDGVGVVIADARSYLDTALVLAYVVIMVGIILLFNFLIIRPIEMMFLPWLDRRPRGTR